MIKYLKSAIKIFTLERKISYDGPGELSLERSSLYSIRGWLKRVNNGCIDDIDDHAINDDAW